MCCVAGVMLVNIFKFSDMFVAYSDNGESPLVLVGTVCEYFNTYLFDRIALKMNIFFCSIVIFLC